MAGNPYRREFGPAEAGIALGQGLGGLGQALQVMGQMRQMQFQNETFKQALQKLGQLREKGGDEYDPTTYLADVLRLSSIFPKGTDATPFLQTALQPGFIPKTKAEKKTEAAKATTAEQEAAQSKILTTELKALSPFKLWKEVSDIMTGIELNTLAPTEAKARIDLVNKQIDEETQKLNLMKDDDYKKAMIDKLTNEAELIGLRVRAGELELQYAQQIYTPERIANLIFELRKPSIDKLTGEAIVDPELDQWKANRIIMLQNLAQTLGISLYGEDTTKPTPQPTTGTPGLVGSPGQPGIDDDFYGQFK